MDYSTLSNKTTFTESEDISSEELSERYYVLKKQFETISCTLEATKQELHETKRSYSTALDVQTDLSSELEAYTANAERKNAEWQSRIIALQDDISTLKAEKTDIVERHTIEINNLQSDINKLKEELATKTVCAVPVHDNSEMEELRSAFAQAESETNVAKSDLESVKKDLLSWQSKVTELMTELQETREIAEIRREELKAANEREAEALSDLAEAKALLHQCSQTQDVEPHAAKGNSLFAEVEDKRQEMAKTLIQMKQNNSKLRRDLANKQAELDALLHEKHTIWEQQIGESAHHDRELIESYEDRITQLEGTCERQRREIAKWFSKLPNATPTSGWLSGVLEHLKTECEHYKAEVLSRGAAQLASAAQIRELRRKLVNIQTPKTNVKPAPIDTSTLSPVNKENIPQDNTNVLKDRKSLNVLKFEDIKVQPHMKLVSDDVKKRVTFN